MCASSGSCSRSVVMRGGDRAEQRRWSSSVRYWAGVNMRILHTRCGEAHPGGQCAWVIAPKSIGGIRPVFVKMQGNSSVILARTWHEFSIRTEHPLQNLDRKSTRLNSSHSQISYAVFCLNK